MIRSLPFDYLEVNTVKFVIMIFRNDSFSKNNRERLSTITKSNHKFFNPIISYRSLITLIVKKQLNYSSLLSDSNHIFSWIHCSAFGISFSMVSLVSEIYNRILHSVSCKILSRLMERQSVMYSIIF